MNDPQTDLDPGAVVGIDGGDPETDIDKYVDRKMKPRIVV